MFLDNRASSEEGERFLPRWAGEGDHAQHGGGGMLTPAVPPPARFARHLPRVAGRNHERFTSSEEAAKRLSRRTHGTHRGYRTKDTHPVKEAAKDPWH
jgi:hypothetical protein